MDNENKVVRLVKQKIKAMKFKHDYKDLSVLSEKEGNSYIKQLIEMDEPFMVARGGATEMRCIREYLTRGAFSNRICEEISTLSGVFPNDNTTLKRFCEHYIECISKADLITLWGVGAETKVVHKHCQNAKFTQLHAIEPYYFTHPWSGTLKGKNVLVVHPFADSILQQYEKRELIFPKTEVLPQFNSLKCIKAVQTVAGQKTDYESWFDALKYMEQQIDAVEFDVAIIGAGAYGLPLASYCKSIGKQAIQMSGATQILFGIKGKRWDEHSIISQFYNDSWIRPSKRETPMHKQKVEGGSYW